MDTSKEAQRLKRKLAEKRKKEQLDKGGDQEERDNETKKHKGTDDALNDVQVKNLRQLLVLRTCLLHIWALQNITLTVFFYDGFPKVTSRFFLKTVTERSSH